MKSFDFVSDLHLDFYSYGHVPQGKQKKMLVKYVQSLLPDEPSDVIIIGGGAAGLFCAFTAGQRG